MEYHTEYSILCSEGQLCQDGEMELYLDTADKPKQIITFTPHESVISCTV